MPTPLKPSAALLRAVERAGGVWKAARAWRVEYNSLRRFVQGSGGISLSTAACVAAATKLTTSDLYDHLATPLEPRRR